MDNNVTKLHETENSEPYIFSLSNGETGNLIEKTPVRIPESALFFWPVGYSWGAEQNGFTVDENTATVHHVSIDGEQGQ